MTEKTQLLDEADYDWTKDVELPLVERMRRVKGDISLVIAKLETLPQQLNDYSAIKHEGPVFMTKSGKPRWKKLFAQLQGDQLLFRKAQEQAPGTAPVRLPLICKDIDI